MKKPAKPSTATKRQHNMTQVMMVQGIVDEEHAIVGMERVSACSGDCHQCGGCGTVGQKMTAVAQNRVGAVVGDVVTVRSDASAVLIAAALVYLVPLVLFFAGYTVGTLLPLQQVLWGGVGFLLGVGLVLWYHRRVRRRGKILYEICAIVRHGE